MTIAVTELPMLSARKHARPPRQLGRDPGSLASRAPRAEHRIAADPSSRRLPTAAVETVFRQCSEPVDGSY
jgi:hypothetical protein